MQEVTEQTKTESLGSFLSAIRKLEKAVQTMDEKGARTGLTHKRLEAMKVGLAMLEEVWRSEATPSGEAAVTEAREVLIALLPSLESQAGKARPGSPQATLLSRRITALNLALSAMDDWIELKNSSDRSG